MICRSVICLLAAGLMAISCGKRQEMAPADDIKDVMIGCRPGASVTVAVDALSSGSFAYTASLCDVVITGPSCLNSSKDRYYTASADGSIKEVLVSSGNLSNSFSTGVHAVSLHYSESNTITYISPSDDAFSFNVGRLDLNTGENNMLFGFSWLKGIAVRSIFMRHDALHFVDGEGNLVSVDLKSHVCTKIAALAGKSNAVMYDAVNDRIFYLCSNNHINFALYSYDFGAASGGLLKDYPGITTLSLSSTTYDGVSGNIYFYTADKQRITINTSTLEMTAVTVPYIIVNTEIVRYNIKKPNT